MGRATRDPDSWAGDGGAPHGYLPVSRLAVGAVALGGCSALAVVSPLFLVVPLVAVVVSLAACRDCERPAAPKAGRLAALAGLALASGFGIQAVSMLVVTRAIAAGRAVAAAEIFLAAVRDGRAADAAAMCGAEAQGAVATLAACGGRGVCRGGGSGDEPGTWIVRIMPMEPGDCAARLVLAPASVARRGGGVERWLVTACDVEGQPVRPSGS
jgi:hypothetical protein